MCVSLDGFYCINVTNYCYFCCATRYSNSFNGGPELIIYHARNYQLKWKHDEFMPWQMSFEVFNADLQPAFINVKRMDLLHFLSSCQVQRVWTWSIVHVLYLSRGGELLSPELGHLCASHSMYPPGFIFLICTYQSTGYHQWISVLHLVLYIPYILEFTPHPFYSFRGLKNQMRIRIACRLDSWSWAGFWKNDRAIVRAVRTIQYNHLLFYLLFIILYNI